MSLRNTLWVGTLLWLFPIVGRAQPFFAPGVTAFTPEIGVVNTGIVSDLSATVSPDRKYVTLGVGAQQSQLLALREFSFQRGAGAGLGPAGFVGGLQFSGPASGAFGALNSPMALDSKSAITLLQQRGMTRIILK